MNLNLKYELRSSMIIGSQYCGIAQWLAHETHNLSVAGSNPAPATKIKIF